MNKIFNHRKGNKLSGQKYLYDIRIPIFNIINIYLKKEVRVDTKLCKWKVYMVRSWCIRFGSDITNIRFVIHINNIIRKFKDLKNISFNFVYMSREQWWYIKNFNYLRLR